jgi:tape measure domain-containing protein
VATISTSIELYDRVSKPVNSMISALTNMCDVFESVERSMDGTFNTTDIEQTRKAIERAAYEVVQLGSDIEQADNKQEEFNRTVQHGQSAMGGLVGKVIGLVGAYASLQSIVAAMKLSDQMVQTNARLTMVNESFGESVDLQQMIYESAMRSRGAYQTTADSVAKLGLNAKDAFDSTAEIVQFAENLNKQFVIAGTETATMEGAMTQLVQALGSGALRGDELNSIFEAAPNIIQTIADYMDVPIGQIKAMASEGQITAEIVKNAMLDATAEINAQFEQMPMTWGQVWVMMKNSALMSFKPVLMKINEMANSEQFQVFATNAMNALGNVAMFVLEILELVGQVGSFISENWSIIAPILWGIVAALVVYNATMGIAWLTTLKNTAVTIAKTVADWAECAAIFALIWAQDGLNAAMAACPLSWIIIMIIAVIALIYAVCAAIAKMTGIANSGFGVITGGISVVIQFFKNLGLAVANITLGIGNAIGALASNMMTAFHNAISSVQAWWYDLMSTALGVVESICAALNKLPFVEFDFSGISAKADEYAAESAKAAENKEEYESVSDAFAKGYNTFDTFQEGWASEALASGASWGDGVMDKLSGFFKGENENAFEIPEYENIFDHSAYDDPVGAGGYNAGQIPSDIADTATNTGKAADAMEISSEDLKYMRDIAERDVVNRFTTAEIRVEMTNNNSISSEMDLDGVVDYLVVSVNDAMEKAAEGVHV